MATDKLGPFLQAMWQSEVPGSCEPDNASQTEYDTQLVC